MGITTKPFDAAKHFPDDAAQIELLDDALASNHAGYIAAAIGAIAKARGMSSLAQDTGFSRQTLHRALSEEGNPTLETVVKVMTALGLELQVRKREPEPA